MTTADLPAAAVKDQAEQPAQAADALAGGWLWFEALLDRAGDRLNPILVKEARQAMKSRQFVITFSLLLVFGWLWTVLFISFGVPAIFYAPVGPGVLIGYYVVLSVPLLIVVPYAAFRSLAAEREDGTYELLSITSLSSRQIVLGKLGSAILQMMVYYSALAPCIAFTYLLRGIDIITIGLFLAYTFMASLLLSIFGLMMATVTRARHWQVLLSVVFVMALLVFTFVWDMMFCGLLASRSGLPIDQPHFWIFHLCLLSFYTPLATLLLFIAGGQITFASENRSTPIRAVLVVPQLLAVGWMTFYWLELKVEESLYIWPTLAAIYWAVAGAFLTGETAQLSPRAKRELPQSFLGRTLFTWFNPGSGTGYVFAMLNLLGFMGMCWFAVLFAASRGYEHVPDFTEWFSYTICLTGYVLGYIGIVRLAVVALRRVTPVGLLATFLVQVIVALCGVLFPLLLQAIVSWGDYTTFGYTLLQLPNFFWTLYEVVERSSFGGAELALIIGSIGGVLFLVNLLVAAREVEHVRQQAPQRVLDDERQVHPQPAERKKRNPWDEEAVAARA
jgi:hypothetical protein